MTGRIVQFATSRVLQAQMALFIHEAHEAGQVVPPITLIQTSGSADRNDRIAAFKREEGSRSSFAALPACEVS